MLITQPDRDRLVDLVKNYNPPKALGAARLELLTRVNAATIVPPAMIPQSVVTMNSVVELIEISSGEVVTYALVYPPDANVDRLKISVLAPLGVAMLGKSEGEIVAFTVPAGTKRYFIRKVVYQPEARLHGGPDDQEELRSDEPGSPAASSAGQ